VGRPTRERVRELLAEGKSLAEIVKALEISKPTVCDHRRRLGFAMQDRCAVRYDWAAIQRYYDEGHSVADCANRFGFTRGAWFKAVERRAVVPRPRAMALDKLLVATPRDRHDNRLEKLQLLCPNCHSQTPNFGSKNKRALAA
jgi:hypothetical protein